MDDRITMTAHPPGESGPAPNQSTTTVVDDTARLDKQELAVRETDVSAPHEARLAPIRIFFLGIAMLLTYFLGTASGTAVTLVIPNMAQDLEVSELSVQWVTSAYSLAYGCGLLFAGRLADIYGRKLLFITGLVIALIFSILSALIRVRVPLCVIRALAGLGLAIASPAGYGIIGANVRHEPARTVTLAALGLGGPIGAATGTILGGAVAGAGRRGWTYLFYILGGAAVIPLTIGILVIPRDPRRLRGEGIDRRIDWLGGFLVTAGTSVFLFSIVQSGTVSAGWNTPYIPALLVISILLLLAFLFWERYLETRTTYPPIVKFSLFTRHNYKVTAVCLCAFWVCASVFGLVYILSILYQNHKGLDALGTAVRWLPANIMGLAAAGGVMYLAPRVRAPLLIAGGAILSGITGLLYAVEPDGTNYWAAEFIALLCLPFGIDYAIGVGNILVSNLMASDEQSVGGALFQTSAQIGGALGICLASLVSTQRAAATGSLLTGLRDASWMTAAFAWIVPLIVSVGLRRVRLAKDVAETLR